ncbi:Retrovirus-related Pol polyprotein from transposon opus, partial [Mucuna pruriens]
MDFSVTCKSTLHWWINIRLSSLPIRYILLHPDTVWLVQHSKYILEIVFSDLLEYCMEVFMDDFTVYVESFEACLENLSRVLTRCIETNLMLNFEKCHFMVTKGIGLGHLVSSRGIKVDKAKVDIITSLSNLPLRGSSHISWICKISQDVLGSIIRRLGWDE